MIAAAFIVRPTSEEALLLDRCIASIADYVDGIFITITQGSGDDEEAVEDVAKKYGARVSRFTWIKDFAAARNFNFAQVPKEYEYILWLDADDTLDGAAKLPDLLEEWKKDQIDAVNLVYQYGFDDDGNCISQHDKTQIVKNDGCVEWWGELHEDFKPSRDLRIRKTTEITRVHHETVARVEDSKQRNLEIAEAYEKKHPDDPRTYWLMANAYASLGRQKEAIVWYQKFLENSNSEIERFHGYLRLSNAARDEKEYQLAEDAGLQALRIRPWRGDAFFSLADTAICRRQYNHAEAYIFTGVRQGTPESEGLAVNPREYDLRPAQLLYRLYMEIGNPEKAKEALLEVYNIAPSKKSEDLISELNRQIDMLGKVTEIEKKAIWTKDKKKLKELLDSAPPDVRSHPRLMAIRNQHFYKKKSSGKDIHYYCAYTSHEWNPDIAKEKGVGGSEEAVIHLARRWVKDGYNVTVYANVGHKGGMFDGVRYRPFWEFNAKDAMDHLILWRSPSMVDHELNAKHVYVDLHDVTPNGEFTKDRLAKIDKIFVKTNAHRVLYPEIPDEKFAVIPNGVDPTHFPMKEGRDPYLLLNTSSADRSLETLLELYEEVINRLPKKLKAKVKLEWYYGWDTWDNDFVNDKKMQEMKARILAKFNNLKEQGYVGGGTKLNHSEIAEKYLKAGAFVYPTRFYEIHCISAVKAQLAGCVPITTDFAALQETVQFGYKTHVPDAATEDWSVPRGSGFGIKGEKEREAWIESVVNYLTNVEIWETQRLQMRDWAISSHDWNSVAKSWTKLFGE